MRLIGLALDSSLAPDAFGSCAGPARTVTDLESLDHPQNPAI